MTLLQMRVISRGSYSFGGRGGPPQFGIEVESMPPLRRSGSMPPPENSEMGSEALGRYL